MRIVVDTNIVFSAIINTHGKIGDLLMNSDNVFDFYSCNFLIQEINKHQNKLSQFSGLSLKQIRKIEHLITKNINFFNNDVIPNKIWNEAIQLAENIDENDTPFIALTTFLGGHLWTGDKKLYNGLKKKGYGRIFSTAELFKMRIELESR